MIPMAVGHYENFPVASLLLPPTLRRPVEVIYRFARSADDFADEGDDPPEIRLAKLSVYHGELAAHRKRENARRRRVPRRSLKSFGIMVFRCNCSGTCSTRSPRTSCKKRYADFAEVLDYCRRSANPVGRLLLHLFKQTADSDLRASDAICSALQLVNFWQDVDIDYTKDNASICPRTKWRASA